MIKAVIVQSLKMNASIFVFCLLFFLNIVFCKGPGKNVFKRKWNISLFKLLLDYYWRDFTGEIPDDAVHGGYDRNNKTIYVVQVYIPSQGILPTGLYTGEKSVTTARQGVFTTEKFIKVLCVDKPEKLSWIKTTASNLSTDSIGKHLVEGGTEDGLILNVGRVAFQGEVVVGKVCNYNLGNALLYFTHDKKVYNSPNYEVLVYGDKE